MPARRMLLVLLLLAFTAALAACGGETAATQPDTAAPPETVLPPEALPVDAPEVGEALAGFVEAAGAGDATGMWARLSAGSQERLGPTESDFAAELGAGFEEGLGSFAGTEYETVLAVETESGWGVTAIAGERESEGMVEFATYGAAATPDPEGDGWLLELGAPVAISRLAPAEEIPEPRPEIRVGIEAEAPIDEAGIWLDGEPLPAEVTGSEGRSIVIVGTPTADLPPGRHVVVVFGRAGDLGTAGAFSFVVTGEGPS